ncbi:hypothetical protein NA57DRAFT_35935 [Rhizodiscina lignyota]|uniref:DH domain-containing protein n=1 Tax=Rhizodiscina lignyota TaxID=1504668 RepID=A0A9P4IJ84_9PEZI|nr:hypothetical protein NA57DRAFT_35935 [Rhizodiscina lignyota]
MAFVLSLQPQSPLKRSFSDTPYTRSCSPLSISSSCGTVRRNASRNLSAGSLASISPHRNRQWRIQNENAPPQTSPPQSFKFEADPKSNVPSRASSGQVSREPFPTEDIAAPPRSGCPRDSGFVQDDTEQADLQINNCLNAPEITIQDTVGPEPTDATDRSSQIDIDTAQQGAKQDDLLKPEATVRGTDGNSMPPFRRWVTTLRRKNLQRRKGLIPREERWPLDDSSSDLTNTNCNPPRISTDTAKHTKSLSHSSSMGFITAVKTASVTLASVSIGPFRSRASHLRGGFRSSGTSEIRRSMDSNITSLTPIIDEATWLRSLQRRKVLEELISTEESYLTDMRAFVNVYSTLLPSVATMSSQIRTSVEQTLTQIVQLHEELLGELCKVIPQAEHTRDDSISSSSIVRPRKHMRWHSADVSLPRDDLSKAGRRIRHSFEIGRIKDYKTTALTADTGTTAAVAKVFNQLMRRFLVYEAWAAHSETMHSDVLSTYRTLPAWPAIERGLESLSTLETSINSRESHQRKGLTLADLLIKPIQRVCKYPLLFESLCKQTPACDDPIAHDEIQMVLVRLRELTDEINKATDDPKMRQLVETTWILQDRLTFDEHTQLTVQPTVMFHLIGRVILCGVLHVAFDTKDRVKGQYMICLLYRSCLLLASMKKNNTNYSVFAVVPLRNGVVDESDNARGLQCHTAPHTWKLLFESQHRLFEIMLSACSAKEEEEWRSNTLERIAVENRDVSEGRSNGDDLVVVLPHELKSFSTAGGQPESMARRMSIQRAATLGPKTTMRQVVIKNTEALHTSGDSTVRDPIPVARSLSHLSTNHVQTLAPRRADRIRLENALFDVWTKDVLPYPGMASRRTENSIRASANSVMRKLSMASIASNFSKRSISYTSVSTTSTRMMANSSIDDGPHASNDSTRFRSTGSGSGPGLPRVDFHNAPNAFLPEDFELKPKQKQNVKCHSMSSATEWKRGLASRIGAGGDYLRELRPLTPILATGRSSRAEGENMTFSEALTRSSLVSEGRGESTTPAKAVDTRDSRDAVKLQRAFTYESGTVAGDRSRKRAKDDAKGPNDIPNLLSTPKKPVKTKSRFFKFWS